MKTGELAKRLDVATSTVRYWAQEYQEYVSEGAVGKAKGLPREFDEQDALVIATVWKLRSEGLSPDQIRGALKIGKLIDGLPDAPTPEVEQMQKAVVPVPRPEYERALDHSKRLEADTERLTVERDRAIEQWQTDVTSLQERITQLSQELGKWRGMLVSGVALVIVLAIVAVALAAVLLTRGRCNRNATCVTIHPCNTTAQRVATNYPAQSIIAASTVPTLADRPPIANAVSSGAVGFA